MMAFDPAWGDDLAGATGSGEETRAQPPLQSGTWATNETQKYTNPAEAGFVLTLLEITLFSVC